MIWNISPLKGSGIDYIGEADVPVGEAAYELWRKYIQDAAPRNATTEWDYLGIYVELDCGGITLFPSKKGSKDRTANARCKLIGPAVLASYHDVANSAMADHDFEKWARSAVGKVIELIGAAAQTMQMPVKLGLKSVTILYYGADFEHPVREEILSG
jgi:hypothetical protein